MGKYIVKRILLMFLTMFIIMTMSFILIKLLPLPAVREMGRDINLILARREKMGYNKPILVQYYLFLKNILTDWDWGVGDQMSEGLNVWTGIGTAPEIKSIKASGAKTKKIHVNGYWESDGDWHPVVSSTDAEKRAEILPFRAFLLPSMRNAKAHIGMHLDDADTDGIDTLETIDEDGTHRYYDLSGRELPGRPARGIYIYNGKKYLNK